jgi:hypothetical protein
MSARRNGRSPVQLRDVGILAGADGADASDAEDSDPEAVAAWIGRDAEAVAESNRIQSFRRERLRADVLSLAAQAVATLRELVAGSEVPPAVRLRASLAILQAADAMAIEEIGPTSAEGVQAKMEHQAFLDSLG